MEDEWKDEKEKWDLEKIAEECVLNLREMNIPIGNLIDINICRDKYISGKITEEWEDEFCLYIPSVYKNPKYRLEEIKTAIFHQLLHSIKDCMNHGDTWKKYAKMVDAECGCRIMEQEFTGQMPGANWDVDGKGAADSVRYCYLDYTNKLMGILEECSDELKGIGLPIRKVSEVRFSKCHNAYGKCRINKNKTCTIIISQRYGKKDADNYALKHLICHELLHTCKEDDSDPYTQIHGPKWREMARKVDRECGYKLMGQSFTDNFKKKSDSVLFRHVCPCCGGYYNANENNKKIMTDRNFLKCQWCKESMNVIKGEEIEVLGTLYSLLGEFQDKLRIARIPIGKISGIGFVSGDDHPGLHDNWDGSYSIDLPKIYKSKEAINSNEFQSYLYMELIKTCKGCRNCGLRWREYVRKAEAALGFPIMSEYKEIKTKDRQIC